MHIKPSKMEKKLQNSTGKIKINHQPCLWTIQNCRVAIWPGSFDFLFPGLRANKVNSEEAYEYKENHLNLRITLLLLWQLTTTSTSIAGAPEIYPHYLGPPNGWPLSFPRNFMPKINQNNQIICILGILNK